nr:2267_t:CDS:2 [Entrophospora candida]
MEEDEEDNLKRICGEKIVKKEGNVGGTHDFYIPANFFVLLDDDDRFLGFKNVYSIASAFNNNSSLTYKL